MHFLRIVGVDFNRPGGSLEPPQTYVAPPMKGITLTQLWLINKKVKCGFVFN